MKTDSQCHFSNSEAARRSGSGLEQHRSPEKRKRGAADSMENSHNPNPDTETMIVASPVLSTMDWRAFPETVKAAVANRYMNHP